jgi:hypothetical protein
MDALVMELSDLVSALRAEVRRLRAAAGHVLDKSSFNNSEELAELGGAMRKLQIELDRFAPSMTPEPPKARKSHR